MTKHGKRPRDYHQKPQQPQRRLQVAPVAAALGESQEYSAAAPAEEDVLEESQGHPAAAAEWDGECKTEGLEDACQRYNDKFSSWAELEMAASVDKAYFQSL